jgi:hypothetical protein
MTVEMAVGLLAGSIPLTMLLLKFANLVKPVDFVRLETEFELFRDEMRRTLTEIKQHIENLK